MQKKLDILGSRNALPEDFQRVIRKLQEGKFVGAIVPLDEAPRILDAWSAYPAKFTKIMVQLD